MIGVISTVGTSLFENYQMEKGLSDDNIENLRLISASESEKSENIFIIENLKKRIKEWLSETKIFSAEIKSLLKIRQEYYDTLSVHLLCTDTILSKLAAEILDKFFKQDDHINIVNKCVIKDLQIEDRIRFEKRGLPNLIRKIEHIYGGYYGNIILNITGGYKAVLPFMTILGCIHQIPIFYIFEDTEELIRIPTLPISYDENLFEKYWEKFSLLDYDDVLEKERLDQNFLRDAESCLEIENPYVSLNPTGKILWSKYKSRFFIYYAPQDVHANIDKQTNIRRILENKFQNMILHGNKIEKKGNHFVYDDGDNNNRIYFFKDKNDKIYIYKTFEDHDAAMNYIETEINREEIIKNSNLYKLEVKNV